MRRIFALFIILSSMSGTLVSESVFLESEYQSFYGSTSFLNNYYYSYLLPSDWSFRHSGTYRQSANKRFDRYSRNADLIWMVSRLYPQGYYAIHLDYNSAVDKAKPDLERYEIEKVRKKIGVDFYYAPLDSLQFSTDLTFINSAESNTRYSEGRVTSNGFNSTNNVRFTGNFPSARMTIDTFINLLDLDYDFSRNYGAEVAFDIFEPSIETELSYTRDRSKIYLLNDQIDTHIRSNYRASIIHRKRLTGNLWYRIGDRLQVRDNQLSQRQSRNFIEKDNSLFVDFVYDWKQFRFSVGGEHRIFSRSFKEEISSREQEQRLFSGGVSYYFSDRDSLIYTKKLNLTQTDYIVSGSILDNDYLIDENQVSLYSYLRDEILFVNHFNYTRREEVYLKSGMSANNKTSRTYNLLPALNIALNRHLLIIQEYHLRADYDDYVWDETVRDRMYRKFSASYAVYSGLPWLKGYTPYLPRREQFFGYHDLVLGVSYLYDTNSSGNLVGDAYEIYTENEYHTLEFELFRRIERVELRCRPRFIWSNERYEFNHLFDFTYILPDKVSYVSIGLNCTGKSIKDSLWRVNALVNLSF